MLNFGWAPQLNKEESQPFLFWMSVFFGRRLIHLKASHQDCSSTVRSWVRITLGTELISLSLP